MLTVISPAKSLNETPVPGIETTAPRFAADAVRLARTARNLTLGDLKGLMGISDSLARLNRDRFRAFVPDPAPDTAYPALFLFDGDTYRGLDARSLDPDALRWAQDRLRILSGLYGLLRPLDAIQPYRLEMGSRLRTRRGGSLYDYWGDAVAKALRADAAEAGTDTLLNCASQEYFRAADRSALGLRVVTPVFLDEVRGRRIVVSFHAKRARGAMARFVAEHRIERPADLRDFDAGGYAFDPDESTETAPVFARSAEAAARAA